MAKYTPSETEYDIEYQMKKSAALAVEDSFERAAALLKIRKDYASQAHQLLAQKDELHDEYMQRMLVNNILSHPNPEHSQSDIQFYEKKNECYRQLADNSNDVSLKVEYLHSRKDLEYINTVAQKIVDLTHKATLEKYDDKISPMDNVKNADSWIVKKENELEKIATKNNIATLG